MQNELSFLPENRRLMRIEVKMKSIHVNDFPLSKKQMLQTEVANLQWLNEFYFHGNMPNYKAQRREITKRYSNE